MIHILMLMAFWNAQHFALAPLDQTEHNKAVEIAHQFKLATGILKLDGKRDFRSFIHESSGYALASKDSLHVRIQSIGEFFDNQILRAKSSNEESYWSGLRNFAVANKCRVLQVTGPRGLDYIIATNAHGYFIGLSTVDSSHMELIFCRGEFKKLPPNP